MPWPGWAPIARRRDHCDLAFSGPPAVPDPSATEGVARDAARLCGDSAAGLVTSLLRSVTALTE